MSHFKEIKNKSSDVNDRNLGDEWIDWNGKDEDVIKVGKGLFLLFSLGVILISDLFLVVLIYMISPRLVTYFEELPSAAWIMVFLYVLITTFWYLELLITTYREKNFFFFKSRPHFHFEWLYIKVVKLATLFGVSKDNIGNSIVKVSNAISKATKKPNKSEKVLVLLPRCLTKTELKKIMDFKQIYPIEVCTVSGGELARKKVKEIKPTAVIGVACERDLVAGIRDVGGDFSVIGIPNIRPNGPCKDTNVDLEELEDTIKFYVGDPKNQSGPVVD